eukprot:gene43985-15979_t
MSGIGVGRKKAEELLSAADGDIEHATELYFANQFVKNHELLPPQQVDQQEQGD